MKKGKNNIIKLLKNLLKQKVKMKNLILFLGISICIPLWSQNHEVDSFSLEQATQYSLENSPIIKNSEIDVIISKKKVWETTAMGLPQAQATLGYQYSLTVPDLFETFSSFGEDSSVTIDDLKASIPFDLTVSQLIFSGPYIVGLQAAKVFKELSEVSLEKSKMDVKKTVIHTYYLALVTFENEIIIDSIYESTKTLVNEIEAMYNNGFVDETDLDQMKLTFQIIEDNQKMIKRQKDLILDLLKYQMGYDIEKDIILTDNLEQILDISSIENLLLSEFNVNENLDYQLLMTQEKLSELDWKRRRSEYLPSLSAYYTHHEQFNSNSVDFQSPDMIGITASIPIFSSGMRMSVVGQSKLEYEKSKNTRIMQEAGLKLQFKEAKISLLNTYDKYNTEKENTLLSKKIYSRTLIKYSEGMASRTELTQVQNQYLNVQSTFFNTIIDLIDKNLNIKELTNDL